MNYHVAAPASSDRHRPFSLVSARSAFSLIEIVLALSIVSIGFLTMVAFLPVGLTNFRGAVDTSTSAQIFQRVMNDVKQADFDNLVQSGGPGFYVLPIRYFDDQGNEKTKPDEAIYQVRIRGSQPGDTFTSLPGSRERAVLGNTTFLTVQVANNPGDRSIPIADSLWQSSGNSLPVMTYSGIVTRH